MQIIAANKKANFYLLKEVLGVYVVNGQNLISDWNLYIKNLKNLYHKHIFEIQDYEKNPEKLWKLKLIEIDLLKMGYFYRSMQYSKLLLKFFKTLFSSPFYFYLVLFNKFFKRKFKVPAQ